MNQHIFSSFFAPIAAGGLRRIMPPLVIMLSGLAGAQAQDVVNVTGDKVGIGTASPLGDLHVKGGGATEGAIYFEDPDGSQIWKMRVTAANDRFAIIDQNASTSPFLLEPGAPGASFRIKGSGKVGLGTAAPAYRLEVEDTATAGAVFRIQNSTGQCDYTPQAAGSPSVSCSSDRRLKKNIRPLDTTSILASLARIRLFEYESVVNDQTLVGPVAQVLQQSHPERVKEAEDGLLMAEMPSSAELLAAVQELQQMVIRLQQKVASLESERKGR